MQREALAHVTSFKPHYQPTSYTILRSCATSSQSSNLPVTTGYKLPNLSATEKLRNQSLSKAK